MHANFFPTSRSLAWLAVLAGSVDVLHEPHLTVKTVGDEFVNTQIE